MLKAFLGISEIFSMTVEIKKYKDSFALNRTSRYRAFAPIELKSLDKGDFASVKS